MKRGLMNMKHRNTKQWINNCAHHLMLTYANYAFLWMATIHCLNTCKGKLFMRWQNVKDQGFLFLFLFFHSWSCWVFVQLGIFSSPWEWGLVLTKLLGCAGFSLRWLLLLLGKGSRASVVAAPGLWSTDSVVLAHSLIAPKLMGPTLLGIKLTPVPSCIGRRILYHWVTWEPHDQL